MRRAVLLTLLTVILAAGSAVAGTSGRTVEREYQPVETRPSFPQGGVKSSSSVTFRARPHERSMTVAIRDDSGLVVPAKLMQDLDGDGTADMTHGFCGWTAKAVVIDPRAPVKVVRYQGSCDEEPALPGSWTTGTVTATFAR